MASQEVLSALDKLHKELDKLEPAIKHVETAQQITQSVKGIPQKHLDLLKEIKEEDTKYKNQLRELFTLELAKITKEHQVLNNITADIQTHVKTEQKALGDLKESVLAYHDKVEEINFPERFIKLESNLNELAKVVKILQNNLDKMDQNNANRSKDISLKLQEASVAFETANKKQQLLNYVTWVLIIVTSLVATYTSIG
ncbi:hypothetical protein [Pontibacter harenae]|uniref:hypothetical protein n=1 Tax=Pontibacter harenae TaxID=2894083 RepID=UPI001E48107D|nr:hypothetical protein [Pontibacter harenae]MCC9168138.1 hypothetical protein [Pontibacter harenae]